MKRLCIFSPNLWAYSETFIAAHLAHLPAESQMLYGGWFPLYLPNGKPLYSFRLESWTRRANQWLGLGFEPPSERALVRFLERGRFHAALAEYGPTGASVLAACQKVGLPLTVHFHGMDAYRNDILSRFADGYSKMFAQAAKIIVVSEDMKRQLITLGAPPEKLSLIPYGVDLNQFKGAKPESAPPHFVAIGRFVAKKAPHLTLQAFAHMLKTVPEARLTMIGNGELWEHCQTLAKELNITQAVRFAGVMRPDRIIELLTQARAFVQHSVRAPDGDSEGSPVAAIEAAAMGLPVVATQHAGLKEIVSDGQTGFLVPEHDVKTMAEKMIFLAQNPATAQTLGQNGRQRALENYNQTLQIQKLWREIEAVSL